MTRYYLNPQQYSRTLSVLYLSIKIFLPAFLLTAAIIISSCEENPTIISTGLLPGSDFVTIRSTDQIGVDIFTQYVDSVKTGGLTYSYLGKLSDPYFGTVRTDYVGQLRLTQKWPGGGAFTIDSVKLYLYILGAKGTLGTDVSQEIKISEIGEMLNSATSYYSNRDPDTITDLGTYRFPIIAKDTAQDMVIPIATEVGQYLMRDTTRLTQEVDSLDFRSFFKGIYVTLKDSPQPFLVAVTFSAANMFIRVFYHNVKTNNLTFDFVMNANSIRYNRYFHDFSTAPPETRIKHKNDGIKDTLSYLQAFNGVFPRIKIPGLAAYKDSLPMSVNRAKMTISVYLDNIIYTKTTVPSQILLMYKAADSINTIVSDYLVSSSFFDGTFNTTTLTYTFNISSFAQQFIEGKIPSPQVEMYFPDGEYRNVILRTNANTHPVIFDFTYTKF
jgi:hypothetical protein